MYRQLLNLYTLKEHLQHQQQGHISLYITPNGKIFDCRQCGVISHCTFSEEFYSNYGILMRLHKDIDFNTEISEFLLEVDNFALKDIQEFYLDKLDYVQYENEGLYHLIKTDFLAVDNILVQDLGFVKVSINRGEFPALCLPNPIFNNKKITAPQYDTLVKVLDHNTISSQNFQSARLIKIKERDLKIINNQIDNINISYSF